VAADVLTGQRLSISLRTLREADRREVFSLGRRRKREIARLVWPRARRKDFDLVLVGTRRPPADRLPG